MNLVSLSGKDFDTPVEVYLVESQDPVKFKAIDYRDLTVQEFCQMIRGYNQTLDQSKVVDLSVVRARLEDFSINKNELKKLLEAKGKPAHDLNNI